MHERTHIYTTTYIIIARTSQLGESFVVLMFIADYSLSLASPLVFLLPIWYNIFSSFNATGKYIAATVTDHWRLLVYGVLMLVGGSVMIFSMVSAMATSNDSDNRSLRLVRLFSKSFALQQRIILCVSVYVRVCVAVLYAETGRAGPAEENGAKKAMSSRRCGEQKRTAICSIVTRWQRRADRKITQQQYDHLRWLSSWARSSSRPLAAAFPNSPLGSMSPPAVRSLCQSDTLLRAHNECGHWNQQKTILQIWISTSHSMLHAVYTRWVTSKRDKKKTSRHQSNKITSSVNNLYTSVNVAHVVVRDDKVDRVRSI